MWTNPPSCTAAARGRKRYRRVMHRTSGRHWSTAADVPDVTSLAAREADVAWGRAQLERSELTIEPIRLTTETSGQRTWAAGASLVTNRCAPAIPRRLLREIARDRSHLQRGPRIHPQTATSRSLRPRCLFADVLEYGKSPPPPLFPDRPRAAKRCPTRSDGRCDSPQPLLSANEMWSTSTSMRTSMRSRVRHHLAPATEHRQRKPMSVTQRRCSRRSRTSPRSVSERFEGPHAIAILAHAAAPRCERLDFPDPDGPRAVATSGASDPRRAPSTDDRR